MKWQDYKTEAKRRGALALELFVVQSTPAKGPEDVKASLHAHLAYQAELEAKGALALAGPMSDESGEEMGGMGMIVSRAENLEAAKTLAQGDPMHASGARSFTIRKWLINEGSLNLSVGLSTKSVKLG